MLLISAPVVIVRSEQTADSVKGTKTTLKFICVTDPSVLNRVVIVHWRITDQNNVKITVDKHATVDGDVSLSEDDLINIHVKLPFTVSTHIKSYNATTHERVRMCEWYMACM